MNKTPFAFEINERVTHSSYGPGTIKEIGNPYTVIDFDENGRRKFVTSMVQLERTTVPEPAPPKKTRAKTARSTKSKKTARATEAAK